MLGALLLAIIGVPLVLLLRTWAREAEDSRLVRRLIDLSVRDPNEAALLLRAHPELLAARYVHDETPLHYCAVEGLVDGVRFLAKAGVPVDAPNAWGDTALADAVTLGKLDVVKVLLALGADPNARSRTHGPLLHLAVSRGDPAVVAALLRAGARTGDVADGGGTVWDAVPKGAPGSAEILAALEAAGTRR